MKKNYFYASLVLIAITFIFFIIGLFYGFTSEVLVFLKPITAVQYTAFFAFAFFANAFAEKMGKSHRKNLYMAIAFFIAMASFYEILFNFFYWFTLYNFSGISTNLDALRNSIMLQQHNFTTLINSLNSSSILSTSLNASTIEILNRSGIFPVNLNLASKIFVLLFFSSLYFIYFLHNLIQKEMIDEAKTRRK